MKKIGGSLLIALFAGAITLGAYKLFFERTNYAVVSDDNPSSIINSSFSPTSAKGAGINEVDFTSAAETTVNAVVHVKNVTISRGPSSLMEFFYGYEGNQKAQIGTGSGVIISPDGHIVTNNHVIKGASQLQVTLNNNKTYEAELVGTDPNSDIALLKIDAKRPLPYLAFGDSDHVKVGEWVLAVGNPFNLTSTVTAGIVSAKARALMSNDQSFIQTDAAVNPGNSGGALVNTNGDLIGINTAISSQTGSYVGYSFAVPSNIAKKVIDDIMEFGSVQKGVLGIKTVSINTPYAIEKGINEIDGVYIEGVEEESGADEADLKAGDIIKAVDQIEVHKFADLTGYLSTKRPGDEIEVTIDREGEELILPVTIKERQTLFVPVMGLEVKNLTDKDRKAFKTKKGVKIVGVPETYRGYGLDGKVLLSVDNEEINNIQEAKTLFGRISRYGKTSITMINKKGERERLIFQ
ncbi:trypsin-like peptidase domain-containing protein [Maribacter polysiphoniae]|uniref:Do/DeqQ family serine protease n=1 Tax=Maribacter polysiphoniae TaxID=429344 RepID=A0A316E0P6_9FLAO|nr:trypsin-like peptidase domain-containing protein [Maribacter polysiphoniae]MBD1261212.1 trypsin-like peptidase domain-containing protein [Maribacter polysiphoniae]PWK23546.1 Do/DeqQ family serine protease [Maribacter polysiphoniae]